MNRTVLHIALGVLLWVVFGYYWFLVSQRPVTDHTRLALVIVGTMIGGLTLFSGYWVIHNLRIARSRNRRRNRRPGVTPPPTDFLGRTFVAQDAKALRSAAYVEVHLVEVSDTDSPGHKIFRITDTLPDIR